MDHNDNAVALLINRYKTSLNAPVLVAFITPEISQNVTIQVGWVIFAPFKVSPSCVWTQSGVDSNTTVTEAEKEHYCYRRPKRARLWYEAFAVVLFVAARV